MREHPIPFHGPMVRAILDGRKTQTRRVVKPQPVDYPAMRPEQRGGSSWIFMAYSDRPDYQFATGDVRCPYGVPGDRLWVRETWGVFDREGTSRAIGYRADDDGVEWLDCGDRYDRDLGWVSFAPDERWRPSIHVPRWASRLTLEVKAVRVERLQEISDDDARAEGYSGLVDFAAGGWASKLWLSNPWVWVIEFERLTAAGGGS